MLVRGSYFLVVRLCLLLSRKEERVEVSKRKKQDDREGRQREEREKEKERRERERGEREREREWREKREERERETKKKKSQPPGVSWQRVFHKPFSFSFLSRAPLFPLPSFLPSFLPPFLSPSFSFGTKVTTPPERCAVKMVRAADSLSLHSVC